MSSKAEKDRQKQIQDRCQNMLTQMLRDDDNKYCVDCDAKGLFIFLYMYARFFRNFLKFSIYIIFLSVLCH